jgi:hypothetical protein
LFFGLFTEPYFSNFIVWISAFWNQHFLVAIATLVALGSLVFQPLGAATLTVRDTWWTHPGSSSFYEEDELRADFR